MSAPEMSGDGRAGATAPTMPTVANDAALRAARHADVCNNNNCLCWGDCDNCVRLALAAAFPVMLAAWIDGLTDEQLESAAWECPKLVRAALTRLGGAHE